MDAETFVRDGYVAIRGAVDTAKVAACQELVWRRMAKGGIDPDAPSTWPSLCDISDLDDEPFRAAGLEPALRDAYDTLIGPGRWVPRIDVGRALAVRFPSEDRANAGYHIEGSWEHEPDGDLWVNVCSRNRGLLALFLFTDVGEEDAPTRLLCGSHLQVPEFLAPLGEQGTFADAGFWRPSTLCLKAVHATGPAGDVFLCHPFIVHTATWPHRGAGPRIIAQPAVHVRDGFGIDGSDPSPVARAIVAGLEAAEAPRKG